MLMKKKFVKFFSVLMVFCLCFLCTGCLGTGGSLQEDLFDKLEKGEITEEEFNKQMKESLEVPMYGTKVLYRSDISNVSGTDYDDFYGKFALWLSNNLVQIYGIYNDTRIATFDNFQFIYDTIRYQTTAASEIGTVTETKYTDGSSTPTTTVKENDAGLFAINADTSKAWNWTFGANEDPISFVELMQRDFAYLDKIGNFNVLNSNPADFIINIEDYFNNNNIEDTNVTSKYLSKMLLNSSAAQNFQIDTLDENNTKQIISNDYQSDLVKAIEYLLYCYSLNYPTREITISGQQVSIAGYGTDVTAARDYMKNLYSKQGTYIGFNDTYKEELIDFILEKVIGQQATSESFTYTTGATLNIIYDVDGNIESYEITGGTIDTSKTVNRNYENTVRKIVDVAYENVLIGNIGGEDGGVNIDQRYLNSRFRDLWGNNFFLTIPDDEDDEEDEFELIPEHEYQSAVMMFSEEFSFDNIYVAVKYGGNNDLKTGFDTSQFIEIKVNLNLFLKGEWKHWGSEILKVPAGEFDASEGDLPNGFSQIAKFEGLEEQYREAKYADWGFNSEDGIRVGAFKPHMGGGILSKGMDNYSGKVMVGNDIKLIGTTRVKDYYKIVEPEENELPENKYYSSGRFNHQMLVGEDMCDYVEITYEVIKNAGDFNTNYNFKTGIYLVM